MIDKPTFQIEMQKLFEQFGDKFSGRKIDLFYNALKYLDQKELCYVIDDLIGNMKYAPTLDDVKAKARQFMSNKATREVVPCSLCSGSGTVVVRKKTGEVGDYGFSCDCPNGKQFPALPKWRDKYRSEFTRQPIPGALIDKFYGRGE